MTAPAEKLSLPSIATPQGRKPRSQSLKRISVSWHKHTWRSPKKAWTRAIFACTGATIYLNEIYLGEGAYGVEAAALTYFGKRAADLNLAEMALLAGLTQSPGNYSPLRNFEAAKNQQRYILNRMAEDGVTDGYTIKIEIFGVGYRVAAKGKNLEFSLDYSHPVLIEPPEGITFAVDGNTKLSVSGIDKQKVGQIAAIIRKLRKDDPYKGKGIRYEGEQIRRKVGKTGK